MSVDRSYPMCFARALVAPALVADLRVMPTDFEVTEQLGFEPEGDGEHIYLWVRKTGANTAWVAQQIARFAGVRDFDVSYAGKKDRHAVTHQWFSCWLPGKESPDWETFHAPGVTVLQHRRHHKKLRRGMHVGNRFRVVLRGLDWVAHDMAARDADIKQRVEYIRAFGFPNYFGEQRFGRDGNNLVFASQLMAGQRVKREKRDIYLSAARSYLFNLALSRRVADGSWCEPDRQGEPASGWLAGISRGGERIGDADAGFSDWHEGLARMGVKAMRRVLAVHAEGLDYSWGADHLVLDFALPAGAYATSLLREVAAYRSRPGGTADG
jgi:tRNA pseudouridine13 synthase